MRLILIIFAVLIGFASSFTAGLYLGADANVKLNQTSSESTTPKKATVSNEAPDKPKTLFVAASPPEEVRSEGNISGGKDNSTALQVPVSPLWLKETLAKARQTPGNEAKSDVQLGPPTVPVADPKVANQQSSVSSSTKNYGVQTKNYIPKSALKKLTDSISELKKSYVFLEPISDEYIGYRLVRVVGFSERFLAREFADILSSKTGQDFLVLRLAHQR